MNRTEQIWQIHHDRLRRFIRSRVHDASAADDILQDVFIRIQSRIGTLREDRKIESWIYQITRHALTDHYRSHKKTGELPEHLAAPDADDGDGARRELAECLAPMIEALPDRYREVIRLSELEGLSQKEVALKKGVSLPAVKSRVLRGRGLIKKMLTDCCRIELDHRGGVTDYELKKRGCGPC